MASTVKLPVIGTANKGTVVGVSIGGLAVAGYLIYRQNKKAKAQSAAAASAAQAASGYGYGMQGLYPQGYYGYGEPGYTPYGYGAMGYTPGGYGYGTPYPPGVQNAPVTTNAQWTQAAINQLTSEGYDGQTVSAALGAYITGQQVTSAQQSIIQAAIGVEGYPPQPGPGGFPPAIKTSGGGGSGQGGGGNISVPNVVGQGLGAAKKAITGAGLKYKWVGNPAKPGQVVKSENPAAGASVASGSTVSLTVGK